jgi:20S proteasome alpha/beta subunit
MNRKPYFRPETQAAPDEKSVTVILAIRHPDGLIMAADTEETAEMLKTQVSKLPAYINIYTGSLVIGGAGSPPYLDDLSQELLTYFATEQPTSMNVLEHAIRQNIKHYYKNYVLAWPTVEERASNDFELLVGAVIHGSSKGRLWISKKGALVSVAGRHAAIGFGAEYARLVLGQFNWEGPLSMYALLAIYVLQRVKRYVNYCGGEYSQIVCLGAQTHYISDQLVKEAEALFADYDHESTRTFVTTIMEKTTWDGFDADADRQTIASIQRLRQEFRALITRMECKPFDHGYRTNQD